MTRFSCLAYVFSSCFLLCSVQHSADSLLGLGRVPELERVPWMASWAADWEDATNPYTFLEPIRYILLCPQNKGDDLQPSSRTTLYLASVSTSVAYAPYDENRI
jgi:hypothetical protein